jgi:hypothetical protein
MAHALAELLERQPTLADRETQQRDAALALGVRNEDRRRPGLAVVAHLQHRIDSFVHRATSVRQCRRVALACVETTAVADDRFRGQCAAGPRSL